MWPKIKLEGQGKMYKTVVSQSMIFDIETWALKKPQENKFSVTEVRMLIKMDGEDKNTVWVNGLR